MNNLIKSAALLVLCSTIAQAQTVISDNYNVGTPGTTGFGEDSGVNAGIATRLTGNLAGAGLRYIYTQPLTGSYKDMASYSINSGRLRVGASDFSGRFTLSADGTTPYDFANALGTGAASPSAPVIYDVNVTMTDNYSTIRRFSFGLATAETPVTFWDFGVQVYLDAANNCVVQRRIDTASFGGTTDIDTVTVANAGVKNTPLNFRMRVTDAGAETETFSSRVQLFLEDVEIYDTSTAADLPSGWRLDSAERYFVWDQAATGGTGAVFYDNFSVVIVPEPGTAALGVLAGLIVLIRRRL